MEWLRIERTLDAPIETVWRMWTEAELFQKWYGPNGMSVPTAHMDVVVGGRRHISMAMDRPGGAMTMWFVGEYKVVEPPHRLVYTESMSDEAGTVLSPESLGMSPDHPEVTEVIVELSDVGGKTLMKMTHVGVPADSGGAGGWGQAIDKLTVLLATV